MAFGPCLVARFASRSKNSLDHVRYPPARGIIAGLATNGRTKESGPGTGSVPVNGRNFLRRELSTQDTAFAVSGPDLNVSYLKRVTKTTPFGIRAAFACGGLAVNSQIPGAGQIFGLPNSL